MILSFIHVFIDPIDNEMLSPYELLFGHKPYILLPSIGCTLKYKHPEYDLHQRQISSSKPNKVISTLGKLVMANES